MDKYLNQLLSEVSYYVLLSLTEEVHGYDIIKNVSKLTNNRIIIAPGTVYSILANFKKNKWITSIHNDNTRRKVYIINSTGYEVLKNNFFYCKELVKVTEEKLGGIKNV